MAALYELSEQYADVASLLYDEEQDIQVILDTLEAIEGEIEDKADNYARLIKSLNADAKIIKEEEERLYARRKSLEGRSGALKDTLEANLRYIGKTKLKTPCFTFTIQKNGGLEPLVITDNLGEIPGKYLIPQPPVVDKEAVRELLKGREVEWAHLEPRGESLRIR